MSFTDIYQISGSAMTAQTIRLNTVASNMANAESPASSEAQAYKARSPIFAAVYNNSLIGANNRHGIDGASVQVQDVMQSGGAVKRYEPHHLMADQNGFVWYPDVNVVEQMADMMSASRDFETDVDVLNNVKSMQQSLLKLGEV
ncbi:flagellar basal body rod protein FlgC [Citrobacter sp. Cf136]|uniref:flagellar basal body rod protein FlgC n=1 Tax=Citrobacter sp. Cf136 TaxID=2985081 RepID=UPI0025766769|nr:flagellar basal body rod protein FlgC [Citrobacter sp. Cf136]MDM3093848.1 flagellar basal body rod protein FlgC [Citrobacter sp. Cf136]